MGLSLVDFYLRKGIERIDQLGARIYRGIYRTTIREFKRSPVCGFVKGEYVVIRRHLILFNSGNELSLFYNEEYLLRSILFNPLVFRFCVASAAVDFSIK